MEFIKNYEVPISLWSMIIDNVAPNEVDEVKSFLGDDLVDQSIELRSEINTLLEIYKTYADELASGDSSKQFLPEPPEMRERLLKEIIFFVNGIREQARLQGRNPDQLFNNRHNDIIDYAYESSGTSSSRPTTSNDSFRSTSRSSYRATPVSERINVSLLSEKLNYMQFEEVQNNLKQFLQEEVNRLNDDLTEIHNSVYHDATDKSLSRMSKHTISELKQERHELEQILLQSSRSLPNNNAKSNQSSNTNIKKQLFKLLPDDKVLLKQSQSNSIKSPPKLKPIETKESHKCSSSYVESPLDLGLPETSISTFDDYLDTNNSSISCKPLGRSQDNISIPTKPLLGTSGKYNSAQKFRQKVLQNRKETLKN